jgi:hypothetical protein
MAKRGDSLRSLYYNRLHYKEKVNNKFIEYANYTNPNYIDLWYEVPFYGKVNTKGALVVPNPHSIEYGLSLSSLDAFPWVRDGVLDFRSYLNRAVTHGKTNLNKLFGIFEIKRSYSNALMQYVNYIWPLIADDFNISIRNLKKPVSTFGCYFKEFLKYLSNLEGFFSFSRFYASNLVTIDGAGLGVEFQTYDHNNDTMKNRFFEVADYEKYVQAAASFGFRVNKNAPWQIIADLASKPMEVYLNNHNIRDIEALFAHEDHYLSAINLDLEFGALILYEGYTAYQQLKEYGFRDVYKVIPHYRFKTSWGSRITQRAQIEVPIEKVKFNTFAEKYIYSAAGLVMLEHIRHAETTKVNPIQRHSMQNKVKKLIKIGSWQRALDIIASFYNPARIYNGSGAKKPFYAEKVPT